MARLMFSSEQMCRLPMSVQHCLSLCPCQAVYKHLISMFLPLDKYFKCNIEIIIVIIILILLMNDNNTSNDNNNNFIQYYWLPGQSTNKFKVLSIFPFTKLHKYIVYMGRRLVRIGTILELSSAKQEFSHCVTFRELRKHSGSLSKKFMYLRKMGIFRQSENRIFIGYE